MPLLRQAEPLAWVLGAGLSLGLSLQAARREDPLPVAPPPQPLPRPATPAEQEVVQQVAAELEQVLRSRARAAGPPVEALESILGSLPDNPLVEGVAGITAWCGGEEPPVSDWLYCADRLEIQAGGIRR